MERMLQTIPGSKAVTVPKAGHLVAGDNPSGLIEAMQGWLPTVA
jgi:pimeloyl-ACP methyl ester carboxylesterase